MNIREPVPVKPVEGETMKYIPYILCILIALITCVPVCSAASTISATNPQDAAALVYVSGYKIDPGVFYPYESGTITVDVINSANASVVVSPPDLIEPHIRVKNTDSFNTKTTIGPGATVSYTFMVEADGTDGTYYPLFSLAPVVYGTPIHSTLTVKVDSADAKATVSQKPDTFSISKKSSVNVTVINPRDNDIINVIVAASSDGADIYPQERYVGTIAANSKADTTFQITPDKPADVIFNISFDNGDNHRQTSTVLPLNIGKDKIGAEIVVNNIERSSSGMTQTLKGDVTNNGLTDAKSVLVTVGSPAKPTDPNPEYAVGSLEPDDFSSFEVSYVMMGNGSIPLIVSYKDAEGNAFTKQVSISVNGNSALPGAGDGAPASSASSQRRGMFGSFGSGLSQVPVTEIVIILIVIIVFLIAWRKGLLKRLKIRIRKDPLPEENDDDDEPKE
jgi:NADH:ubiquinone oxidoreductase subunit 3 (subunit A)